MSNSTVTAPTSERPRNKPLFPAPAQALPSIAFTEQAEATLVIRNSLGLHARPAACFVKAASTFQCEVTVSNERCTVSARSILGVLTLAAHKGSRIHIRANGEGAREAVAALAALIESGLGEN